MKLGIIIPTYNEVDNIYRLVRFLKIGLSGKNYDLIVSDGGSSDNTLKEAERAGARAVLSPQKGRAAQMNFGARLTDAEVLYFVHADIIPPQSFYHDIKRTVEKGYKMGRYAMWFKSHRPGLVINSLFSQLNLLWCSGGDQTPFITRPFWNELGGYDPQHVIMEEYDLMKRARKKTNFKVMRNRVLTTDRKYKNNGYFKVNVANLKAFLMWRLGYSPEKIYSYYSRTLNWK